LRKPCPLGLDQSLTLWVRILYLISVGAAVFICSVKRHERLQSGLPPALRPDWCFLNLEFPVDINLDSAYNHQLKKAFFKIMDSDLA
jgi:hypothetical protein